MVESGILTQQEFQALDLPGVQAFWKSAVGKSILACPHANIHHELPFTVRITPEELARLSLCENAAELQNERFIGRGQVDLAVIQPKEIWILDFKTDHIKGAELKEKCIPYGRQLKLYALALGKIYRRPVTKLWLHFLTPGVTVDV